MKKIIFSILVMIWLSNAKAQIFYASTDSIVFLIQIVNKKDTPVTFKFKIINNSSSYMYIGKDTSFKQFAFINDLGETWIVACGGAYPFTYDRNEQNRMLELCTIKMHDSLIFYCKIPNARLKSQSYKPNIDGINKKFFLDYILTEMPFKESISYLSYTSFLKAKSRLAFFVPATEIQYSHKQSRRSN